MPGELDDLDAFLKRTGRGPLLESGDRPASPEESPPIDIPKRWSVPAGLLQGAILNPIEGAVRLGQFVTAGRGNDPAVLTSDNPLNRAMATGERFRRGVQSSTSGYLSEMGGMIIPGVGEIKASNRLLGMIPSTLGGLSKRAAIRAGMGAAEGAISQPADTPSELAVQTGMGSGLGLLAGRAAKTAFMEKEALRRAKSAAVVASGMEQEARAAMQGVKRKDPLYASLAEDYGRAKEIARAKRAAIPEPPKGFWEFMHGLPHYWKLRVGNWLLSHAPPGTAGGYAGMGTKALENPDNQ